MSQNETIEGEFIELESGHEFKEPWKKRRKRKKKRGTRIKDFPSFGKVEIRNEVLQAASLGLPPDIAAYWAGITPSTLNGWLKRGEGFAKERHAGRNLNHVDNLFADFFETFMKNVSAPALVAMGTIAEAAKDDPDVAEKWLKLAYPNHFGAKKVDVNIQGQITAGPNEKSVKLLEGMERKKLKELRDAAVEVQEEKDA